MANYTGLTYGDYTITNYIGNQTYEAICNKCGKHRTYRTQNIRFDKENGGKCTCTKSGIVIGDRFGRLVVKSRDFQEHTEKGVIYWLCQCDCGNEAIIKTKSLKSGNTRSCGCLNDEARTERIMKWNEENGPQMIGLTSGWLTVLREATADETIGRRDKRKYWYCECQCGNHHIVETSDFTHGKVQSCGCLNSKGEAKISSILESNNIHFVKQYTFSDLISGTKHYAYDFAIFDNNELTYLIEFDGIQHFSARHQFTKDESSLKIIQERDRIKDEYAHLHSIPLIRIPYTHLKELEYKDLDLKTSQFII